ncbi:hypothetical protein [Pseudoroseicyclus tamaricis]|nr:hypothetical protein [Pseudoroseicyclus tamaricis]
MIRPAALGSALFLLAACGSTPDEGSSAGSEPVQPAAAEQPAAAAPATSTPSSPATASPAPAGGPIGPADVTDELAADMAAFGESGATINDFIARYGQPAERQEDVRFFRLVGETLYYGSPYGSDGPSIWVEFDPVAYVSTMIHVPQGGNAAPYDRFF